MPEKDKKYKFLQGGASATALIRFILLGTLGSKKTTSAAKQCAVLNTKSLCVSSVPQFYRNRRVGHPQKIIRLPFEFVNFAVSQLSAGRDRTKTS